MEHSLIRFWQNLFYPQSRLSEEMAFLAKEEHYIPIRFRTLVNTIVAESKLSEEEQKSFRTLSERLEERFHFDYHSQLIELCDDFAPFDPDRETIDEWSMTAEEVKESKQRLYQGIHRLLTTCNFLALSSQQLDACLKHQSYGGLSVHVDTRDFESFSVYYRGVQPKQQSFPFLFLWKTKRQIHILKRVFIFARLREELGGNITIKFFKDIPAEEIKLVAPKVRLGMPIFDRVKVGGTFFSGLVTTIYKLVFAASMSLVLFAVVFFGLILAGIKGFFSFLNSKTKYLHAYSSSLYSQSLSNNICAITALVHAAEEQEVREAILGYYFLYLSRRNPLTEQQLDEQCEEWFESHFHYKIDFEVDDAIRKLREKNLLFTHEDNTEQAICDITYSVCDLSQALYQLDKDWDNSHLEANRLSPLTK